MELAGKKILVVGLGKTGLATASFLLDRGVQVAVTDLKGQEESLRVLPALKEKGERLVFVPYDEDALTGVDLVVPSPGVPPKDIILSRAAKAKIPIMSELELAWHFIKKPIIAITGTNGKTTTVTLLGEILNKCGLRAYVGGNIGSPLIGYAAGPQEDDYIVAEVSSFQLEWTEQFRPRVAALLNVSDDHLDYHGSFTAYRVTKERIFANQKAEDLAIINGGETWAEPLAARLTSRLVYFSAASRRTPGMFLQGESLIYEDHLGNREEYPRGIIRIPGRHNLENCMAAILAARECGCPPAGIIEALGSFRGIAHRIEYAGQKKGILFYDDSKGTNIGAVQRALETFDKPIILLMGGRDKDSDFKKLAPYLSGRVKGLVTFGEAGDKIAAALEGSVSISRARGLRDAVLQAYAQASPGEVVLLSPGCASFDEFSNYAERGMVFRDVVKNL